VLLPFRQSPQFTSLYSTPPSRPSTFHTQYAIPHAQNIVPYSLVSQLGFDIGHSPLHPFLLLPPCLSWLMFIRPAHCVEPSPPIPFYLIFLMSYLLSSIHAYACPSTPILMPSNHPTPIHPFMYPCISFISLRSYAQMSDE